MNYTLKKTETNRKNGKFLYEVIDEYGNVISTRSSNREYVACTIYGGFYFGRIDLIGKGEHGRCQKIFFKNMNINQDFFDKHVKQNWESIEQFKSHYKNKFDNVNSIAYLK